MAISRLLLKTIVGISKRMRDPACDRTRTRIAVYARDNEAAFEAAKLWSDVDPGNTDAQQVLTVMSLRRGNIEMALFHLEKILNQSQGEDGTEVVDDC